MKTALAKFPALKIACMAAAGLTLLVAALPAAAYGPRVSIGGVYQQTSSTTSPDGINQGACNGILCHILFQPVLGQQQVIIEHVSCAFHVLTSGVNIRHLHLYSRRGTHFQQRYSHLVPSKSDVLSFNAESQVLHPLDTTDHALIYVEFSQSVVPNGTCTISGHLVTP